MNDLPDLTTDPRALRVCKRPAPVPVVFASADGICHTLEGQVQYRKGDALLSGSHGEQWPVRRDLFLAGYAPIPPTVAGRDGAYCKLPSVTLALQLDRELMVPVGWQSNPLRGRPGDWLLRYANGSFGVVRDDILRESYEAAPNETRWPR